MPRLSTFILLAVAAALSACGPDWREYRSAAGKFSVQFPCTNTIEREVKDGANTVHLVTIEVDSTTAYGVSWYGIASPEKPAAELLQDAQAKILRDLNAGIEQAGEIKHGGRPDGAPGRAFTARTASGVYVSIRLYAVGAKPLRVYQLTAAAPDLGRAERDIKAFFDSFKLID